MRSRPRRELAPRDQPPHHNSQGHIVNTLFHRPVFLLRVLALKHWLALGTLCRTLGGANSPMRRLRVAACPPSAIITTACSLPACLPAWLCLAFPKRDPPLAVTVTAGTGKGVALREIYGHMAG
jgi:hypothetical protein